MDGLAGAGVSVVSSAGRGSVVMSADVVAQS
jgi:hypothetical protein